MGDLKHKDYLKERLAGILELKNLTITSVYGAPEYTFEQLLHWFETYGDPLLDYITDTTVFLSEANQAGKQIMFEAQLGALRDIDFGIYPYTSSSNVIAAVRADRRRGSPFKNRPFHRYYESLLHLRRRGPFYS